MTEVDEYFKLAASNFKIAATYLEDTESSLHTLVERLENSLERLRQIPHNESLLWKQLDVSVPESKTVDIKELKPVSF